MTATPFSGIQQDAGDGAVVSFMKRTDIENVIRKLETDKGSVAKYFLMAKKGSTFGNEFSWAIQRPLAREVVLTGTTAASGGGSTTLTVGTSNIRLFAVGDRLVHIASRENLQVTAIDAGAGTMTVLRATGDTPAGSLGSGTYILRLGKAKPEGAVDGTSVHAQPEEISNFTQIHERDFGVTRTAQDKMKKGGYYSNEVPVEQRRAEMLLEFHKDVDLTCRFGEKGVQDVTHEGRSSKSYKSGGFVEFVPTANKLSSATPTEISLGNWLTGIEYAADNAILLSGNNVHSRLTATTDTYRNLSTDKTENKWGQVVTDFTAPNGQSLGLVNDRHVLKGQHAGVGMLIAPGELKWCELHATEVQAGRQANNSDTYSERIYCEAGPNFGTVDKLGYLSGVTARS